MLGGMGRIISAVIVGALLGVGFWLRPTPGWSIPPIPLTACAAAGGVLGAALALLTDLPLFPQPDHDCRPRRHAEDDWAIGTVDRPAGSKASGERAVRGAGSRGAASTAAPNPPKPVDAARANALLLQLQHQFELQRRASDRDGAPSWTTLAVAVLLAGVSAALLPVGVPIVVYASHLMGYQGDPFWWGLDGLVAVFGGSVVLLAGGAILALALLGFVTALMVYRRSDRARAFAIGFFLMNGLGALAMTTSPRDLSAAVVGASVVGVVLIFLPTTSADFAA